MALYTVLPQDWLKPGGKLFITDYCCTEDPWSDVYAAYVKQRGYNLLSVQQYGKVRVCERGMREGVGVRDGCVFRVGGGVRVTFTLPT